jgi:hypothetical protein
MKNLSKYQKLTLEIYNLSCRLSYCYNEEYDELSEEFIRKSEKLYKLTQEDRKCHPNM